MWGWKMKTHLSVCVYVCVYTYSTYLLDTSSVWLEPPFRSLYCRYSHCWRKVIQYLQKKRSKCCTRHYLCISTFCCIDYKFYNHDISTYQIFQSEVVRYRFETSHIEECRGKSRSTTVNRRATPTCAAALWGEPTLAIQWYLLCSLIVYEKLLWCH